jgi:hypothetical protein
MFDRVLTTLVGFACFVNGITFTMLMLTPHGAPLGNWIFLIFALSLCLLYFLIRR